MILAASQVIFLSMYVAAPQHILDAVVPTVKKQHNGCKLIANATIAATTTAAATATATACYDDYYTQYTHRFTSLMYPWARTSDSIQDPPLSLQ
jgi:hypothetical protein